MTAINIRFEDLMQDEVLMKDSRIEELVHMIIANRQIEEMYDAAMEQQLLESLADAISQKITDEIVQQHGAELESTLSDTSMEEALEHIRENSEWDVPEQELPEMINHFAPAESDMDIFDRFASMDTNIQERTMDKLAQIEGLDEYEIERQVA